MNREDELYQLKLKNKKMSQTKPRRAVFQALRSSNHQPLAPSEIISMCADHADRASIYRSIEALETAGIIKRVHHGWKYKLELSDEFHGHHHHMTCVKCGRIHATHDDSGLEKILTSLATNCGYKMTDHHVEIRGICSNCQEK